MALDGLDDLERALTGLDVALDRAAGHAVTAAGGMVASLFAGQFNTAGGARSSSGVLAGSVETDEPRRVGFGVYEASVGPSGVEYARVIELGHRAPGPRPKFEPFKKAWDGSHRDVVKVIRDAYEEAIRG